jgi:hypothetical protein
LRQTVFLFVTTQKEGEIMPENKSMIATFRQQQALHEQAAQHALSGLAAVAYHAAITKRMEQGAERMLRLMAEGKHEEAKALMLSDDLWEDEEQKP